MATATKAPMPAFTGKYAQIRKDLYKGYAQKKYDPARSKYKTEAGFYKAQANGFKKVMALIDKIESAGTLMEGQITIMWGTSQATATLDYYYIGPDGRMESKTVSGTRTNGWGYDKESTAFANAAENSIEFMKILMDARAKKKDLGYGAALNAGKPFLPHFNGGVGMNSIWDSMEKAGYKFKRIPTYNEDIQKYEFSIKRKPAVRRS